MPPNNPITFATFALASPTVPAIVPGNSTATFTFRVNINAAAPAEPATLTARVSYTDANNPTAPTTILNRLLVWTIQTPTITCYADASYITTRYNFNEGATVYPKASGLPASTNMRIRFYDANFTKPAWGRCRSSDSAQYRRR